MKKKEVNLEFVAAILLAVLLINPNVTGFVVADLEKPVITYDANSVPIINEEHITYVLYALDVEDLKNVPFTSNYPEIEIATTKRKIYFTSYVVSHNIETYKGQALNPDIQLRLDEGIIAEIIKSSDPKATAKDYVSKGWIGLNVYASNIELFFKGYWDLYNLLKP